VRKQAIPIEELPGQPVMNCGWSWTAFFFTLFAFLGMKGHDLPSKLTVHLFGYRCSLHWLHCRPSPASLDSKHEPVTTCVAAGGRDPSPFSIAEARSPLTVVTRSSGSAHQAAGCHHRHLHLHCPSPETQRSIVTTSVPPQLVQLTGMVVCISIGRN
jgi:hypothetical protein